MNIYDDPEDRPPFTEALDTIKQLQADNAALRGKLARLVEAAEKVYKRHFTRSVDFENLRKAIATAKNMKT